MLKDALHDYLGKTCDTAAEMFAQLQESPGKHEAIHELRVSGKKLRAFFAMADQLPEYSFKPGKYLSSLKLIQSASGPSRDAQLQQRALSKYEKSTGWRFSIAHLLLRTRLETASTELETAIKRTSFKKLQQLPNRFKEAIHHIHEGDAATALLDYTQTQYASIAAPSRRAHHTVWHAHRKEMKTLYYQLNILSQLMPHHLERKKMLTHTRKAGELLGTWHDSNELLLFVKETMAQCKKEEIFLPVNAVELLKLIQQDTKMHLVDCFDFPDE
ncbi:MAG TPA: CHAD domain-containing protein [Chitinophaga sp.]|uniref:CHAD domain-containing protein n=1 Tax=Chitinophaga sp. TaxID=1869181 RepID=UPI002CE71C77|nr:CHAD domain-containing protein [Chitinophaga sp.]HVI44277.1 CHAD domain-containing protein [Chitinophaga sp.]